MLICGKRQTYRLQDYIDPVAMAAQLFNRACFANCLTEFDVAFPYAPNSAASSLTLDAQNQSPADTMAATTQANRM